MRPFRPWTKPGGQGARVHLVPSLFAAALLLQLASTALAVEKCSVKVDRSTGNLQLSASGVADNPVWGADAAQINVTFPDPGCYDTGKQKLTKCLLGASGTLAARTPPEGCELYLSDSGGTPCKVLIKGCMPAARLRDASFTDANDPRGLLLANQAAQTSAIIGAIFHPNADLSNTDLTDASLGSAIVTGTNFSGTILVGVDFSSVNLSGKDFS